MLDSIQVCAPGNKGKFDSEEWGQLGKAVCCVVKLKVAGVGCCCPFFVECCISSYHEILTMSDPKFVRQHACWLIQTALRVPEQDTGSSKLCRECCQVCQLFAPSVNFQENGELVAYLLKPHQKLHGTPCSTIHPPKHGENAKFNGSDFDTSHFFDHVASGGQAEASKLVICFDFDGATVPVVQRLDGDGSTP